MIDKKVIIILGIFCMVTGIVLGVWGFSLGDKLSVMKIDLIAMGVFVFLLGVVSFVFLIKAKK